MSTYVISDIHGQYDLFMELLDKIDLKADDTLYILGDVVDRGPHSIKTLLKLMEMPNVIPIIGNHELMAITCLKFLNTEITEESIKNISENLIVELVNWQFNGGMTTIEEFRELDADTKQDVIDYLGEFIAYEELTVGENDCLLIHGGLGEFSPEKTIEDYTIDDIVWSRANFNVRYFPDKYVVTGHTPTQAISDNPRPGYIYRNDNGHIAIDCGVHMKGGRLAAICLDTGEEFYSSENTGSEEQ